MFFFFFDFADGFADVLFLDRRAVFSDGKVPGLGAHGFDFSARALLELVDEFVDGESGLEAHGVAVDLEDFKQAFFVGVWDFNQSVQSARS